MWYIGIIKGELLKRGLLSPKCELLDGKDYNSPIVIQPKRQKTKNKYLEIYYDYVTHPQTEATLAKKYNMNIDYVSRIIKWAALSLRNQEPGREDYRRIALDQLTQQLVRLETIMGEAKGVREKMAVQGEIRRTLKLVDQLRKLLTGGVTIDMSRTQSVEMHTADGFSRRRDAAVDAEEVEDEAGEEGREEEVAQCQPGHDEAHDRVLGG